MMICRLLIVELIFLLLHLNAGAQLSMPRLVKNGSVTQLLVDNTPFLILGRMNGDQDHQGRHVRIPANDYSIQHVKLYSYPNN